MHDLILAALLVAALAGVATTATGIVACLRPRSVSETLLAVYVVAWAEVVLILLALSAAHAVTRGATLACVAAAGAGSALLWQVRGRPRLPPIRPAAMALRSTLTDPLVGVAGAAFALVLAYSALLALGTPANDGDALAYHLARAAFWAQEHAIGYVPNPTDGRLGPNPPNAEIGQLFTLVLGGSDRFVTLPQLVALPAAVVAVYAIARRTAVAPGPAVFGALLFGLLPVVVLQSSTALNDLVAASFVAAATPFALASDRRSHLVAGLAAALAVGTKSVVPLLLVPLLVIVLASHPMRRGLEAVATLLAGVLAGSYWSLENLHVTGKLDGGLSEGQIGSHSPADVLRTLGRLARRALDLPGTEGWQGGYYAAAGVLLLAVAFLARRRRPELTGATIRAAALVTAVPAGVALLALLAGTESSRLVAEATGSWYGPAGIVAVFAASAILVSRLRARGGVRDVLLAGAPFFQLALIGVGLTYDPFRGRFLIPAMALSAATWGVLLGRRWLAAGTLVLALVTVSLSLQAFASKPVGIPVVGEPTAASPWGKPRWFVQTILRPDGNERAILRFVERDVPASATVALAVRPNDFLSPYFGSHLTRTVRLVPDGYALPSDADWVVIAPQKPVGVCLADWRQAFALESGWRVLRRVATGSC